MYFPRYLVGMFATTIVVGTWIYVESGSFWTAIIWSAITLIILQVGYFTLVVRSVYGPEREDELGTALKKREENPVA
ncbi:MULTISPECIES: exopolysaccharide production repressor protein [unclassified Mesorhizobium]|uniref:exopolysaccharide production repressor protein n=1 Tax=unclassified Mesorhizobium TaxID=325217 RepID=UPI000F74FF43|nr:MULTISPECIES: exopolysaccharide production repressor protein [unclassified Mesorhizobium]AZO28429.1 hypothetical protein EJ071_14120 [Mesorhizobium sp. M1B.F.Ca.ET.045.04.1.1]RWA66183.1 MAG: hypothetical protein EOQ29_26355 [Mesorhizobium sp.]RWA81768.1 MAG: hypothetical protein EOQ30_18580 [Mesorhizobium sp.]RWB18665.1 MAG: hypothetical protein EOQ40_23555 [Mesorhizobium sp.]TIS45542.1 MAG: hypothetical protein E5W96_30830 [Mesorhizobium sp.]